MPENCYFNYKDYLKENKIFDSFTKIFMSTIETETTTDDSCSEIINGSARRERPKKANYTNC
ncbi:hypothetical protein NUACC21_19470 [Scytonema sp. NUACC21]